VALENGFDDGPEAGSIRRPRDGLETALRRRSRRSSHGLETALKTGSGRPSEESSRRRLDGLEAAPFTLTALKTALGLEAAHEMVFRIPRDGIFETVLKTVPSRRS